MFQGQLLAICIADTKGAAMQSRNEVELDAGFGIVGDRYALAAGAFSKEGTVQPSQEITLIEEEALVASLHDSQLEISHSESRRNLLTRGVPLNHLVGTRFRVGKAELEGVELCEPCKYLERITEKKVIQALLHRGGLRARVVVGGSIQVGDCITA